MHRGTDSSSDNEVIKRVRKGHNHDFRFLVDGYQARVYALAYRMLGRREDAEDALQETFLRAFQSIHSFSAGSRFWPWLRRITVNCCLSRLSKEFPSDEIDQIIEAQQPVLDPVEAEAFRICDRQTLNGAVAGLPDMYRTVIVMKYLEDFTAVEIAELLGESAATIRVRLHRALKMLYERLAVTSNEL